MTAANRRTRGGARGAQPPASYLDTGGQLNSGAKRASAERVRTPFVRSSTGQERWRAARERRRAAAVRRALRQSRQGNPHTRAAVERRHRARAVLQAALELAAEREDGRATLAAYRLDLAERAAEERTAGDVAAVLADEAAQLAAAARDAATATAAAIRARADQVRTCGRCRALWVPALDTWATGDAGLVVAAVTECGHRLCAFCAPRVSRRNRRRLAERVAAADLIAHGATARTLAPAAHDHLDTADQAAAFFAAIMPEVPPAAPPTGRALASTATAYVDERGDLIDAPATPLPLDHVARELHEAQPYRVRRQQARDLWMFRLRVMHSHGRYRERQDRHAHVFAARAFPQDAARAVERAREALALACAREDAASQLRHAERAELREAIAAAVCVASVAAGAWAPAFGPPRYWHREQLRGVAAATSGQPRTVRAWEEADARAWRRFQAAQQRTRDAATRAALARARALIKQRADERRDARKAAAHAHLWRSQDVRFITLTTRPTPGETAPAAYARTAAALARMTRSVAWRDRVAGAAIRIEMERSTPATRRRALTDKRTLADAYDAAGLAALAQRTRAEADSYAAAERKREHSAAPRSWWHPHVHVAASCGFWERADLLRAWRMATRSPDSLADVRPLDRGRRGMAELAKYVTKPLQLARMSATEAAELVDALQGRRTLRCTGALRGLRLEREDRAPTETTEAAIGDGHARPIGFAVDPSSLLGRRAVFLSPSTDDTQRTIGEWRDDADAQEAVRAAKERAHDLAQQHRTRQRAEELPVT